MLSPFAWVTERAQPRVLAGLTVLLAGLSVCMQYLGQDLITVEAPNGIVSYELARSFEHSAAILASWSPHATAAALLMQGLDYLYLCVYPAWLSLAAARLGAGVGGVWTRVGLTVSWLVLGSAALDAVENYALIVQLSHGPSRLYAELAWACAVPKFALVALAGLFLMLAGCAWLIARIRAA